MMKKAAHTPARPVRTRDQGCFERAISRGQPTFTLVGQDRLAPDTIRDWAKHAARHGASAEKIGTAMLDAATFEKWQRDHGSKYPD